MKSKTIFRGLCALTAAAAFAACGAGTIEGEWVEPVPGMEGQVQGVKLEPGGRASSVDMATLQYEAWERQGDRLILSGDRLHRHAHHRKTDRDRADPLEGGPDRKLSEAVGPKTIGRPHNQCKR